jgi:hypothetical protein
MAFTRPEKPATRLNRSGAARGPSARETTACQSCTLSPAMRASNASCSCNNSETILAGRCPTGAGVAGPAAGLAQHSVPSRRHKGGTIQRMVDQIPAQVPHRGGLGAVPCPQRYPWSSMRRCGGSPCASLSFRPCASARRRSWWGQASTRGRFNAGRVG